MRTRQIPLIMLAVCVGFASAAAAQKKRPPGSYAGTAEFRCNGLATPCTIDGVPLPDKIVGDGTVYVGSGTPEGGEGAHLRIEGTTANHEMWIGVRNARRVYIDFVSQDLTAPCVSGGSCVYPSTFDPSDDVLLGETYAEFQSQVVSQTDSADVTPTLLSIPDGATWRTRLNIGFNAGGRLWNFNFSDTRSNGTSTGSRNAFVTRLGPCAWRLTDRDPVTGVRSRAELSTLIRLSGKQFRSFEGLYETPFEITFEASGCPGTFPQ